MKKIFLIIALKVVNGEYEYKLTSTHQLEIDGAKDQHEQINAYGEKHAEGFYGNPSWTEDETYYFYGGEVAVQYSSYKVISAETYKEICGII